MKTPLLKQELRITCGNILDNIVDKSVYSKLIFINLIKNINLLEYTNILVYCPLLNEFNIYSLLLNYLKSNKKEVNIFLPYFNKLKIGNINNGLKYVDKYKAYEPKIESNNVNIELVLIPGLAFSVNGYRLGRGSGWYDKYLKLNNNSIKIGIIIEKLLFNNISHNSHDIAMNYIITESRFVKI